MLISHRYKFIFLKTEKSASSSLFHLFKKIVSDSDKLYRAHPKVKKELLREYGTLADFSFESCTSKGLMRQFPQFFGVHRHGSAADVRSFLGSELFDSYTKITSERNPWDRQVSLFAHRVNKNDHLTLLDFDRCIRSPMYNALHYNRLHNWNIYAIDNQVVAGQIIRFEHLQSDLERVLEAIGLDPDKYALSHSRGQYRKNQGSYRDHYTAESRELVRKWYAREIDYFGYEF
jgi:hypothetical protein